MSLSGITSIAPGESVMFLAELATTKATFLSNLAFSIAVQPQHGTLRSAILSINVKSANGQPVVYVGADPLNPGKTALFIFGTNQEDDIQIKSTRQGKIEVRIDVDCRGGYERTFTDNFEQIVVYGQAGDDHIQIHDKTAKEAWLFGGAGDDHLQGGAGQNLLMGGTGDDEIQAGQGRDVLIGGTRRDYLRPAAVKTS